jgi:hypothetical protein
LAPVVVVAVVAAVVGVVAVGVGVVAVVDANVDLSWLLGMADVIMKSVPNYTR